MILCRYDQVGQEAYEDYLEEWSKTEETMIPWATSRPYDEFIKMMSFWEGAGLQKLEEKGFVPATLYFLVGEEGKIMGALHFRHELLPGHGEGHMGYGIRPSMRGKGYGKLLLGFVLDEAVRMGFSEVKVCCNEDNLPSRKIIEANGGFLESRQNTEDQEVLMYWIPLKATEN